MFDTAVSILEPRDKEPGYRMNGRGPITRVRELSRNVPDSDVRSESGVEPPAFGRVHIPSNPIPGPRFWSGAPGFKLSLFMFPQIRKARKRVTQVNDSGKTQERLEVQQLIMRVLVEQFRNVNLRQN